MQFSGKNRAEKLSGVKLAKIRTSLWRIIKLVGLSSTILSNNQSVSYENNVHCSICVYVVAAAGNSLDVLE